MAQSEDGIVLDRPENNTRFRVGRNGDNLLTMFQCDLCHYRNIMGRDPQPNLGSDTLLLRCIRRASLDSLWAREPSTVSNNLNECRRAVRIGSALGFANNFPSMGPFPLEDNWGMKYACTMLIRSLDEGKTARTIQFGTMRKLRSCYTNVYHSSKHISKLVTMAKDIRKTVITDSPTYGLWFERFMLGCHKRMGEVLKQDMGMSIEAMHKFCDIGEENYSDATSPSHKLQEALLTLFGIVSFCGGLRGEEVPLVDLFGLFKYLDQGTTGKIEHVIIPLLGRFKGERGEKYHLLPLAAVTKSGIQPRKWVDRVAQGYGHFDIRRGPVWRSQNGYRAKLGDWEGPVLDRIKDIQNRYPHIISPELDVYDEYGVSRSFRRGSNTHVRNMLGPTNGQMVVDFNNRWRKFDRAQGRMPSLGMSDYYTEIHQALPRLIQYSACQ